MFRSTHTLRRFAGGLAMAGALAVVAVPQALAGSGSTLIDGRSPDTIDAARAAHAQASTLIDGRSPDTIDAAIQAHEPVVTIVQAPGFQWGDFGIGVAAALGAVLLLVASTRMLATRQSRKQPGPVAAA